MGKKKKPFIDKKHSVRFHLVHRDQRDPLQADPDASERVLHPVTDKQDNKEEQKKHGIFFDDEYDYMQHLRPRGDGVLVAADEAGPSEDGNLKDIGGISLPRELFASEYEEDEGMLGKGVLPRGPQPDWDPDIVEALDDGLDLDDPDNILEDDFMMLANTDGGIPATYGEYDNESDGSYSDREFGSDDFDLESGSFDNYGTEETKSRFTNYSMTSSVIRRTKGLQLIDDQFEKVMEEYDDEEIGGLDEDEPDLIKEGEKRLMDQAITELDKEKNKASLKDSYANNVLYDGEEDEEKGEEFEKYKEPEKEQWDCESIISTYSNLYNHPKLIKEPKAIKLTKRLAIPSDILKKKNCGDRIEEEIKKDEQCSTNYVRNKNESKEEKKLRKNAVKDERRNRRVEKKSNKVAFKQEQKIQERVLASQPQSSTVPF